MEAMHFWMVCSKIYGFATWMKDGWMGGGSGSATSEPGGFFESCFCSGAILEVRRDKYPPESSAGCPIECEFLGSFHSEMKLGAGT